MVKKQEDRRRGRQLDGVIGCVRNVPRGYEQELESCP